MPLNVLSLFSGIGGLELGLERAGMRTVGQVEIDDYCRRVLAKHWPNVPRHDDVRTAVDWWRSERRPRVDVVCGGYPCQPFSTAGKMLGAEDPRHLWPAYLAIVRALRPRYIVAENVPGHLHIGFDIVLGDLAASGFDAEWSVVPASALGGPQRRPRLFLVAYPEGGERLDRRGLSELASGRRHNDAAADTHWCRTHEPGPSYAGAWAPEPRVERLVDGLPGRLAQRHLHAIGNSVAPPVAEYVGRLIVDHASAAA